MKKNRLQIGPGAASLILIIVVLSLSVLGLLSLMSARNDLRLARRSVDVIGEVYSLNERAEETLAALDALVQEAWQDTGDKTALLAAIEDRLTQGIRLENEQIVWTEHGEGRRLLCAVRIDFAASRPMLCWSFHQIEVEQSEMGASSIWN